jgi:hypothetical protein
MGWTRGTLGGKEKFTDGLVAKTGEGDQLKDVDQCSSNWVPRNPRVPRKAVESLGILYCSRN